MTHKEAEAILTKCNHSDSDSYKDSTVTRPDGEIQQACCHCWNAYVAARKQARKEEIRREVKQNDRIVNEVLAMADAR